MLTRLKNNIPGIVIFCCYFILILNASRPLRPIWLDEFLHFALAGSTGISEAAIVTLNSIGNVNHGQTGVYMLIDFLLLEIFGASGIALRAPSILSAVVMFWAADLMISKITKSSMFRFLLIVFFAGQGTLLYFVGEARPYMPLASAAVCMLAYYSIPEGAISTQLRRALMAFGIFWGVLFHPFFPLYWSLALLVGYASFVSESGTKASFRGLFKFSNPIFVFLGAMIYLLISAGSWLFRPVSFSFDPFQWISDNPGKHFFDFSHTQFMFSHYGLFLIACILALIISIINKSYRYLFAPIILLIFAFFASIVLSYISFARSYWILPRQWVASIALVPIGLTWFLYATFVLTPNYFKNLLVFGFAGLAVGQAFRVQENFARDNIGYFRASRGFDRMLCSDQKHITDNNIEEGNKRWVELANRNISCGGNVWYAFRFYYVGSSDASLTLDWAKNKWNRSK